MLLWITFVNCYFFLLRIATGNCYWELLLWNTIMNYYNERRTREGQMKQKALIQGKDNMRWKKNICEEWTIIMREEQGKERWNMKLWYKGRIIWGEKNPMWIVNYYNETMKQKALVQGKDNVKKNFTQCKQWNVRPYKGRTMWGKKKPCVK